MLKIKLALFAIIILFAASTAFASQDENNFAVKSINNFALSSAKFFDDNKSFFFSPYSIISALGMTYAGAEAQTAKEFEDNLLFNKNIHETLGAFNQDLISNLDGNNNSPLLKTANKIWLNKNLELDKNFENILEIYYKSSAKILDFTSEPEQAKNFINKWAAEQTNNKINNLINKITPDTQLILTNAIYFNGKWAREFSERFTKREIFNIDKDNKLEVDMMKRRAHMYYTEQEQIKILRLPYTGRLSMIAMLPKDINLNWHIIIEKLSGNDNYKKFNSWLDELREYNVDLWLPKFKTENNFELKDILIKLGLASAFSNSADFSGMINNKDLKLKIDNVIHKTFIDVSEKQTEAAAATAIMMTKATAAAPRPVPKAEFHADRPFVYFIIDDNSKAILFMGMQNFN